MAGIQEETVLQAAVFDTEVSIHGRDIGLPLNGTSRQMIPIKKQVDAQQRSEKCQTQIQ